MVSIPRSLSAFCILISIHDHLVKIVKTYPKTFLILSKKRFALISLRCSSYELYYEVSVVFSIRRGPPKKL